ncbi:MAG: hypothetical protein ACE5OZ_08005 [Candidatus Heimdallarchaeota archaeon]
MTLQDPSSDLFSSQVANNRILTEEWLLCVLERPGWRFRLLGGIIQFVVTNFASMEPVGSDYLIRLGNSVEDEELKVFLDAIRRLSLSRPLLIQESPLRDLYVLLPHP